jgi:WD40 repeat protein
MFGSLVAAAYYQRQEKIAQDLTREAEDQRTQAVEARNATQKALQIAEDRKEELRNNLYVAEMNLLGHTFASVGGIGRARDVLARWRDERPDLLGWEWHYLDRACRTDLRTLTGHPGAVYTVAWSPDGTRLVSGGADSTARVWDAATGKVLLTLPGHANTVKAVAWSPDGRRIATGGENDPTARVWDAASGKLFRELGGHTGGVSTAAWSPDGRYLACGCWDGTVRIWDADGGRALLTYHGHNGRVWQIAWSPDGRRMASAGDAIHVWDPFTGKVLRRQDTGAMALAWSPDGKRLAVGTTRYAVLVFDAGNGELIINMVGHTGGISTVAWEPDGRRLVSGSMQDWTVRVWDPLL